MANAIPVHHTKLDPKKEEPQDKAPEGPEAPPEDPRGIPMEMGAHKFWRRDH